MPTTMKLIAKNVLGSDTASVTFSSIPGTYTDLLVMWSARTTRSGVVDDLIKAQFNAAGDTNLTVRYLRGTGSTAASNNDTVAYVGYLPGADGTINTHGSGELYIPNYAGSTAKSMSATGVNESNQSAVQMGAFAVLWNSTAAITEIKLLPAFSGNLATNSSFFLYGITKA